MMAKAGVSPLIPTIYLLTLFIFFLRLHRRNFIQVPDSGFAVYDGNPNIDLGMFVIRILPGIPRFRYTFAFSPSEMCISSLE